MTDAEREIQAALDALGRSDAATALGHLNVAITLVRQGLKISKPRVSTIKERYRDRIEEIKRFMDHSGRYLESESDKKWTRDLEIYNQFKSGETVQSLEKRFGLVSTSIRTRLEIVGQELEKQQKLNDNPQVIGNSPLPVRVVRALEYDGREFFDQLHGVSISHLMRIANLGLKNVLVLIAYLDLKHPDIRLVE